MAVSMEAVKELRERTGAGIMDCKKALEECDGDIERSIQLLRKKGYAEAEKKEQRETLEGWIGQYVHTNGKIGVLVEVNCETDFVARNDEFQTFVKDVCMQVAATDPLAVSREDLPQEVVEEQKQKYAQDCEGKPPHVIEKIVNGKMEKFYEEKCLLNQKFIKDETITIGELMKSLIAKFGENIRIRRFVRFEMGKD